MSKRLIYISFLLALLLLSYCAVLCFPSFLFENVHKNENIYIYSDETFPDNIELLSRRILHRVRTSGYYDRSEIYRVYISNDGFRWKFLSNRLSGSGGVNYTLFRGNSFIRPSNIGENRIIAPGNGLADAEVRDLVYFISHEIAHGMMAKKQGVFYSFASIPHWLTEGYADHVAKATFDFDKNLEQFISNEWRLSAESGLYVRYHLMLLYLLDYKGLSLEQIMANPPNEKAILSELKILGKNLAKQSP
ncbi:hypothetical protein SAMN02745866_04074 [Alteromonadaceae bacterium Bs31]|nr:hypothetical protein SAMN02745866_04074 [Alteromonadaceae bacterium Bs31]